MTNGIRKVRNGVDIIEIESKFLQVHLGKCFRIRPRLQQSFPYSRQNINRLHSAWCTTYWFSTFFVSIFLVLAKGRGKRTIENETLKTFIWSKRERYFRFSRFKSDSTFIWNWLFFSNISFPPNIPQFFLETTPFSRFKIDLFSPEMISLKQE